MFVLYKLILFTYLKLQKMNTQVFFFSRKPNIGCIIMHSDCMFMHLRKRVFCMLMKIFFLNYGKKIVRLPTNFPSRSNLDLQELHNYAVSVSTKPNTRPNINLTSTQL